MRTPMVELLWFEDCPNHEAAEALLRERARALGIRVRFARVEVADEASGLRLCFPGSPTLRVDGIDVEPGWEPCDDCTPRCRLYVTAEGLRGLPDPKWLDDALLEAVG